MNKTDIYMRFPCIRRNVQIPLKIRKRIKKTFFPILVQTGTLTEHQNTMTAEPHIPQCKMCLCLIGVAFMPPSPYTFEVFLVIQEPPMTYWSLQAFVSRYLHASSHDSMFAWCQGVSWRTIIGTPAMHVSLNNNERQLWKLLLHQLDDVFLK